MLIVADYGTREVRKQMIPEAAARAEGARLFSIGHSNHDFVAFVRLLAGAAITTLADVRSHPFSRRHPQFDRPQLEHGLRAHGIAYLFLGDCLGGRPAQPGLYHAQGRVDYDKVRAGAAFGRGLECLLSALEQSTVAMLCSEADPLDCHRGLMITPALLDLGIAPGHILRDGTVETTAEMEQRLLAQTRVGEGLLDGLFAAILPAEDRRWLVAEAYRVQAGRKAFRLRPAAGEPLPDPGADDDWCD
jgi:hypothetical protein